MRRILIGTLLFAGLAPAAVARSVTDSGPLWATVNSCSATEVGVRASMPGDANAETMRVRFAAQWYSPSEHDWVPVDGAASSRWIDAGSAAYDYQQVGWTFEFEPLAGGTQVPVRGVAAMQWLSHGQVTREDSQVTQAGVSGVDVGGSRATCALG